MKKKLLGIILLSMSCLTLNGCEKVDAYKEKINEISTKNEEVAQLNLGKDIVLDHYEGGKYSVTFNKVKKTDKRNEFASSNIKDVIVLDYKFENYSVNDNISISEGIDYKIYDDENNLLITYPIAQAIKYPIPASQGVISSGSIAFGSEKPLKQIYISVYNKDNQAEPVGKIEVNLED